MTWRVAAGLGCAMAVAWLALVLMLARSRPQGALIAESLRLIPDTVQLLRLLATDEYLSLRLSLRLLLLFRSLSTSVYHIPYFILDLIYAHDPAIDVGGI